MARKSKDFRELLNQQRANKDEQKALQNFRQKVQQGSLKDKVKTIVMTPQGDIKMSEVLEEFIEPYLGLAEKSCNLYIKELAADREPYRCTEIS